MTVMEVLVHSGHWSRFPLQSHSLQHWGRSSDPSALIPVQLGVERSMAENIPPYNHNIVIIRANKTYLFSISQKVASNETSKFYLQVPRLLT